MNNKKEYDVSREGVITSNKRNKSKKLTQRLDRLGNPFVTICINGKAKRMRVAVMVAEAYLNYKQQRSSHIIFKDEDKTNCSADNLIISSHTTYKSNATYNGIVSKDNRHMAQFTLDTRRTHLATTDDPLESYLMLRGFQATLLENGY